MSRRRLAALIVCTVFLLLIASTVRSMLHDEASVSSEAASEAVTYSNTRTAYASDGHGAGLRRYGSIESDRSIRSGSPDAGVEDLFTRELRSCAVSDCWSRRRSPDGGVGH